MTWWRRLLRQQALERELDAELRDHIEREIAGRVRGGESEADARRQMRLTSGGLDQVKEVCRDVRRPPALADLAADVRFACRVLVGNGWATTGAILTLALAMGVANTTFISTYADLWRDFPFERPDRIAIMRTADAHGREAGRWTSGCWRRWLPSRSSPPVSSVWRRPFICRAVRPPRA
jgi:hypothetical protein